MNRSAFFMIILTFVLSYSGHAQYIGRFFPHPFIDPRQYTQLGYIILKTGEKIEGKRVDIGGGSKIFVDKVKYKLNEVKIIQIGIDNFTNVDGTIYKTVLAGDKISVYTQGFSENTGGRIETMDVYYYKKGTGRVQLLRNLEDVRAAIGDCKFTKGVMNLDKSDLKDEFKENHNFLIEYFEKYNKECN